MCMVEVHSGGNVIHKRRFKGPSDAHGYAAYCMVKLLKQGYEPIPGETEYYDSMTIYWSCFRKPWDEDMKYVANVVVTEEY